MSKIIKRIDQRRVQPTNIYDVSKERELENWLKMQQKRVINDQSNGYNRQKNNLPQFISANPRMRALYEYQMKLVYLNNFYNQRRQQMLYAAYIFAQNKLKYNNHLQHPQNFANGFMQQNICNALHISQMKFLNQQNISPNNNFCNIQSMNKSFHETNNKKTKKVNKQTSCNKAKNTFSVLKTNKLPVENKTDIQITTSTNKKIIENHMEDPINSFAIKKKHPSTTAITSKQAKTHNSISYSNEISIRLPNATESFKSTNCMNSSSSASNQILVSEKQAEIIVNQVKEQMRGRDPENMYIKCPLCEKRIKRLILLV